MDVVYRLANASVTVRIMHHLMTSQVPLAFVTVLHHDDDWIIRVKSSGPLTEFDSLNFEAFLAEHGEPYQPHLRQQVALDSLEVGLSPQETLLRYQVTVLSHGIPCPEAIRTLQHQCTQEFGYGPPTLMSN